MSVTIEHVLESRLGGAVVPGDEYSYNAYAYAYAYSTRASSHCQLQHHRNQCGSADA